MAAAQIRVMSLSSAASNAIVAAASTTARRLSTRSGTRRPSSATFRPSSVRRARLSSAFVPSLPATLQLPSSNIRRNSGATPPVTAMAGKDPEAFVKESTSSNVVVVFSKTYCPYCTQVKTLFQKLKVAFLAVELDRTTPSSDGDDIQRTLQKLTGQRTVPSVFINGQHIGGCDDTYALYDSGKLVPLLKAAGVSVA